MKESLRQLFASFKPDTTRSSTRMPAAVLVPLLCKGNEINILFTKRSEKVLQHKGEISFPGGAYSSEDRTLEETALRESWEEIGLEPNDVEIIGKLNTTETLTSNYVITPFVGLIPYPYNFRENENEIAEILIIPAHHFLRSSKTDKQSYDSGWDYDTYTFEYQGNIIWGATAIILRELLGILNKADCGAGG